VDIHKCVVYALTCSKEEQSCRPLSTYHSYEVTRGQVNINLHTDDAAVRITTSYGLKETGTVVFPKVYYLVKALKPGENLW
jgi:hypothetical protein